jgi:ADP-ribose pyrophosphatase
MTEPWKSLSRKKEYECRLFQVYSRQSVSPVNGKEHTFYSISTHNWVNVIALTAERKVLLISQFRHGSQEVILEIPGGAIDASDASPLEAAKRELLEETGHAAQQWHLLGQVQPNPAILDNLCYFFLALDAKPVAGLDLDDAEELEVIPRDIGDVPGLIQEGKIQHAIVVAAFHFFELFRKDHPGLVDSGEGFRREIPASGRTYSPVLRSILASVGGRRFSPFRNFLKLMPSN